MSRSLYPFRAVLILLWLFAYYALYYFGIRNGLLAEVWSVIHQKTLPNGTSIHYGFTGFWPLDVVISGLVTFFWVIMDGNTPYLSLANIPFAGGFVATYVLAFVEAARCGNDAIPSATTLGVIIQMHGFATVIPFYLCYHLSKSSTIFAPSTASLRPRDYATLQATPWAVLVGYVLFTILVSLPTPIVISSRFKINAIAIWLTFPAIGHFMLAALRKYFLQKNGGRHAVNKRDEFALLRRIYAFGLVIAAASHLYTVSISASALLFPGLFNEQYASSFLPSHVFVPTSPFRQIAIESVAEGVHLFMQWDYLLSGIAYVIWGLLIRHAVRANDDSQLRHAIAELGWTEWLEILLRVVILGPIASALSFVWERDEIVFAWDQFKDS